MMYRIKCQLCDMEPEKGCDILKFTWNGIDSLIYSCQPCESLIHFAALSELRSIRDRVAMRLKKAREEEDDISQEET